MKPWLAVGGLVLASAGMETWRHLDDLLFWGLVLWSGVLGPWPGALWALLVGLTPFLLTAVSRMRYRRRCG